MYPGISCSWASAALTSNVLTLEYEEQNHDCLKCQLKISIRSDDAFVPQGLFEGVRLTLEVVLPEQWLGQLKQFLSRCFLQETVFQDRHEV